MELVRHPLRSIMRRLVGADRESQPLLDPANFLFDGDLVVIGAHQQKDVDRLLALIALEQCEVRDVLLLTEREDELTLLLLSVASGLPLSALEDDGASLSSRDRDALEEAKDKLASATLELSLSQDAEANEALLRRWARSHSGGLVLLTAAWHLSLITDCDAANAFVGRLKQVAKETSTTLVLPWWIAPFDSVEAGLTALHGAGAAQEDTDLVVLMKTDRYGSLDEVRVVKNRHGACDQLWPRGLDYEDQKLLGAPPSSE